ncbi:MAG: cation diffusion facilitator family transporter [Rhodospirillaceae bacterium]
MVDKKTFVALTSVAASGTMTVAKLVVGLMTGSLGILSEAIHSLLDLASATMTYFAVRISDTPADDQHHYGHGKVEALSALFATLLLVLTSFWIIWESVHRLLAQTIEVEATWYAVVLILVVIVVDINRSRALLKVAKETGSQALEADAMHYMSDILSSAAVLLGLGFVWYGWPRGDAIAALFVAFVVLAAAWHLGKNAVEVLIDTAPKGIAERVAAITKEFDAIVSVKHVRVRPAGSTIFADILVRVSRTLSLESVQELRQGISDCLRQELPNIDVRVDAEPMILDDETVAETVRAVAASRGLSVHDIDLREASGKKYLSFDVEMDEHLPIRSAHEIATALEQDIIRDIGTDVEVTTHIDPRRYRISKGRDLTPDEVAPIANDIANIAMTVPMARDIHHLRASQSEDGLHIAFHCRFDGNLPLKEVHQAASHLEQAVLRGVVGAVHVVVHTEPSKENS